VEAIGRDVRVERIEHAPRHVERDPGLERGDGLRVQHFGVHAERPRALGVLGFAVEGRAAS
jgi:hypothetical protein